MRDETNGDPQESSHEADRVLTAMRRFRHCICDFRIGVQCVAQFKKKAQVDVR